MDEKSALLAHAPSHVDARAIGVAVAIVAGGIALALLGAWAELPFAASPANAPNNAERPNIEGPVQQTAPRLEREALLREKRARLEGRGVDPKTGEPYVPIEEAMKAMVDAAQAGRGR